MVMSITSELQKHCHPLAASVGVWERLKSCKSFLSALKEVDWFIRSENIEGSTRSTMCKFMRDVGLQPRERASDPSIRHSINYNAREEQWKKEEPTVSMQGRGRL
jgi:hypothetical protein